MTKCRSRVFSLLLALCLVLPLLFSEGLTVAVAAELGRTTADNVNVRSGAGSSEPFIFKAPNGLVCEILGQSKASGKMWYRVKAINPENQRTYWGYILEDYFRPLTAEEVPGAALGQVIGAVVTAAPATATPDPGTPATDTPEPTATPTPAAQNTPNPSDGNTPVSGMTGTITAGGTNFREAPSMHGHSMLRFDRNTVVEIISIPPVDDNEHFYGVRYDNKNGYVRCDCIRPNSSTNTATLSPVVTPTPNMAEVDSAQLILSSAHLRSAPGGTYDPSQDWLGKGSVLPLAGFAVEQGGYAWYPVTKNGKTYYVRTDCVQLVKGSAVPTIAPTTAPTAAPGNILGYVKTTKSGCNLRASIAGSTIVTQVKKNVTVPYLLAPVQKNNYTWYYVEVDGLRGYLRSDVVKVVQAPVTAAPVTPTPDPAATPTVTPEPGATETPIPGSQGYVKATSNVNMRQKAGYTALLGEVKKGTVMPYFSKTTVKGVDWYYVQHPTMGKGYVHGNYLAIVNSDGTATPTPEPAATDPAITVNPGNNQQEASYNTLRVGDTGEAVTRLVTALQQQGYYNGTITSKYTTAVATAVKAFQRAKGLSVDGTAGAATQHALYNTVPPGTNEKLTMTIYPAEKVDWWTGGINELWKKGDNYKIYDVKTGIVWWCHRWSGGYHVDGEPLTSADTARLCKCYGVTTSKEIASKNLYQRRPILVTIGNRTFACSLYGVPHNYPAGDTIANNAFDGQLCVHFSNSWTHGSKKVDSLHTEAIQYAYEHAPNGKK